MMNITTRPPMFGKAEFKVGTREQHLPPEVRQRVFSKPVEAVTEEDARLARQEHAAFGDTLERQSRLPEAERAAKELPDGMTLTAELIPDVSDGWGHQRYQMSVTQDGEEVMPPLSLNGPNQAHLWGRTVQDVLHFLANPKGFVKKYPALFVKGGTDSTP